MITKIKPALRRLAAAALPVSLALISLPYAKALGTPNRTKIPFSFQVGNRQLPAGEYDLARVFCGNAYALTNIKTGESVMISLPPSIGTRPGKLIFNVGPNGRSLAAAR